MTNQLTLAHEALDKAGVLHAAAPTEMIQYHPQYLTDTPRAKTGRGAQWSSILMFDRVKKFPSGREKRTADCVEFTGETQDEADAKMVKWIEEHGATEK